MIIVRIFSLDYTSEFFHDGYTLIYREDLFILEVSRAYSFLYNTFCSDEKQLRIYNEHQAGAYLRELVGYIEAGQVKGVGYPHIKTWGDLLVVNNYFTDREDIQR